MGGSAGAVNAGLTWCTSRWHFSSKGRIVSVFTFEDHTVCMEAFTVVQRQPDTVHEDRHMQCSNKTLLTNTDGGPNMASSWFIASPLDLSILLTYGQM